MAQTHRQRKAQQTHPQDQGTPDWFTDLDRWIDTAEGVAWLKETEDARSMETAADRYGDLPGLAA